jgi:hypothetical protein
MGTAAVPLAVESCIMHAVVSYAAIGHEAMPPLTEIMRPSLDLVIRSAL